MGPAGARRIAHHLHRGQVDQNVELYVAHLDRVAAGVVQAGGDSHQQMAAFLHAAVEHGGATLADLALLGAPPRVVRMVDALTRRGSEPVTSQIDRVMRCRGAALVKRVDILDRLPSVDADIHRRGDLALGLALLDLPKLQGPQEISRLIAVVEDDRSDSWLYAVAALGWLRAAQAVSALAAAVRRRGDRLDDRQSAEAHWIITTLRLVFTGVPNRITGPPPTPDSIAILEELARDPQSYLRTLAIEMLGRLDDPRFTEVLIGALTDPEERVSTAATLALGRSRSDQAFQPLLSRLQDPDLLEWQRVPAAAGLGTLGDPRAVPHLLGFLGSSSPALATTAAEAIVSFGDRSVIPALRERLRSGQQGRAVAAWALGELRAQEAVKDLAELLVKTIGRNAEHGLASDCAEALGKIGSIDAVPALLQAATRSWGPRREAIWALGKVDPNQAVDVLIAATEDPWLEVQSLAARALAGCSDRKATPRLIALCSGPHVAAAIEGLRRIADERAAPALVHVIRTTNERRVRNRAGQALVRIGSPGAWLVHELMRGSAPVEARRVGTWVLPRVTGHDERALLVHVLTIALRDRDEIVRARAAAGLGLLRLPPSLEALGTALDDPVPKVRASAAAAIGLLGQPEGIPFLERCRKDPSRGVRRAAEAALRRLGAAGQR